MMTTRGPKRALHPSFQTGRAVKKRNRRAAQGEVPFQGQEKNREPVVKNPRAHSQNDGSEDEDIPAVKSVGGKQADRKGFLFGISHDRYNHRYSGTGYQSLNEEGLPRTAGPVGSNIGPSRQWRDFASDEGDDGHPQRGPTVKIDC
jgi:hypothetical protein